MAGRRFQESALSWRIRVDAHAQFQEGLSSFLQFLSSCLLSIFHSGDVYSNEETNGQRPIPQTNSKDALLRKNTRRARETFVGIVQKHNKAVFTLAYARVGNSHDAEDIRQEVFIEVWRNIHKLGTSDKIPAWLYTVTVNKCKDHFRGTFRRKRRETAYAETAMANPSNPSVHDSEVLDAMFRAIISLPEKIRTVIMLKHFAMMSYSDISRMTGLTKATIDGRLRAGKRALRKQLAGIRIEAE